MEAAIVIERLDSLDRRLDNNNLAKKGNLFDLMQKALECVVCKETIKALVIAPCCSRIIGYERCVNRWLESSLQCPMCRQIGEMFSLIKLQGTD